MCAWVCGLGVCVFVCLAGRRKCARMFACTSPGAALRLQIPSLEAPSLALAFTFGEGWRSFVSVAGQSGRQTSNLEFPFALSCRSHRWETQPKCMPLQPNFTAKGRLAGGWGAFRRCLATSASRPRPVRWSSGAPSLRWGGWGRPCAWRLQIGDFGHFSYWRLAGCGHSRTRIPRVHPSRPEVMRDEPQANYNDMLDPLRQSKNKQTRTGSCALRERLREPSRGRCHLAGRCSGARTGGQGELTQTNGASSMPFLPIY